MQLLQHEGTFYGQVIFEKYRQEDSKWDIINSFFDEKIDQITENWRAKTVSFWLKTERQIAKEEIELLSKIVKGKDYFLSIQKPTDTQPQSFVRISFTNVYFPPAEIS